MSFGAYTTKTADAAKDHLDHHLKLVEHHLDQVSKAVPQAGATTSRLDEVKEIARDVVGDLHDVIDGRTDSAPAASGGSGVGLTALSVFGFDYWDEPGAGRA